VTNLGSVKAPGGLVVMAAGDSVYLGQDGSNIAVELDGGPGDTGADVYNAGLVDADNGAIVLAAGDSFSGAVGNVGVLAASAGQVTISAASVENDGMITVDGREGDAGDIGITAAEEIVLGPESRTTASAGRSGSGGNVILKSEGTTVVSEGAAVEAKGGSESGDGGFVEVSGEHFVLAGEIDASAANGEPGTLFIDPLDVTILAGAGAAAPDTVYEAYIEDQSQAGTNVIVEAEKSITIEDIPGDGEITGGSGDITLRTTDSDGSIMFLDADDSITTTLGDIVIEAGAGGIKIGSLVTGKGLAGERVTPGKITVTTVNGGNIVMKDLFVGAGAGSARIYVSSSGDLTIEGDVSIGTSGEPILDIPGGSQAEAVIHLSANDDVILDDDFVGAYADGTEDDTAEAITWAYIRIFAGKGGTPGRDIIIRADLTAQAKASADGKSRAYIELGASDNVYYGPDAAAPVAEADPSRVQSYDAGRDSDGVHIAKIIINSCNVGPEPPTDPDPIPDPGGDPDPDPTPDPDPQPDPDPEPGPPSEPDPPSQGKPPSKPEDESELPHLPIAPIQREELGTSGCSTLMKWAAAELGIGEKKMEVWVANSVASAKGIQPCDTCARLKAASVILRDTDGRRVAALAQVIDEFASSSIPPSEEQDASIIAAITDNTDPAGHYAMAAEFLDSLAAYVGIVSTEMNFSKTDSVILVANRYVSPLARAESDNVGLAAFLAARLAALSGS
ncbi:MAG: autotransporter outer membrane beta-barrel domain-containing protein, partial [Planctomycetota bacterium]